jgi:thiamine pyrophosphate-dependent acetolactate synthase large subunit-like protein
VTVVYGGHGGALVPLVNAIVNNGSGLKWVCVRNEANASLMAAAQAKLTGQLGCCIATSGPGATNLTTGLMEAVLDQVPVLALTGVKPRQGLHFSEFQDVDQSKLFHGGGIEFSYDVASPEALIPLLRDAVATALTKSTCAHLAIPVDVQASTPCPIDVHRPFCAAHAAERVSSAYYNGGGINMSLLQHIAHDLTLPDPHHQERQRILIAVGVRAISAGPEILNLAEILHAPIVTRLDAKGCIDENHALSLGIVGVHGKPGLERAAAVIETADIVLNFGVSDMTLLLCNTAGLQIRPMIEFEPTALLVNTRFRANYTCIGDISEICKRLAEQLLLTQSQEMEPPSPPSSPLEHQSDLDAEHHSSTARAELASQVWASVRRHASSAAETKDHGGGDDNKHHHRHHHRRHSTLAGCLMEKIASTATEASVEIDVNDPIATCNSGDERRLETTVDPEFGHPADVLQAISTILEEDDVVCVDTGDVTLWAALCLTRKSGRTLSSERLGTMGYALCAGIASCLAKPNEPSTSIVLVGDGGFQMTLNELATFQQCKHPGDRLIVLVFDNELLGRVRFGFADARGCELHGPNFAALAVVYGGQGYRVTSPSKARDLVQNASLGLTILHIPIDPNTKADMAAFKDGAITMMNSG